MSAAEAAWRSRYPDVARSPLYDQGWADGARQALLDAADAADARAASMREAFIAHNANRDLSTRPPIRPDLRYWGDATEAQANALRRRAREMAEREES